MVKEGLAVKAYTAFLKVQFEPEKELVSSSWFVRVVFGLPHDGQGKENQSCTNSS